jgi:tRNA threonylcarbamoyladenosine biosynthesis protein TsaE
MTPVQNNSVFTTSSAEETVAFAEKFAKETLAAGDVVLLAGELGAGKTQFAKGVARAFGINDHDVSSPTFSLVNEYDIVLPNDGTGKLFHLDCYRFEKPDELLELGVEEYLYPNHAITLVEWPERIEKFLPEHRFDILIEEITHDSRRIAISKK